MTPTVPTTGSPSTCQIASGCTHAIAASTSPAQKAAKYRSTMERGLVMMGRQDRAQRADGVDRCGKPRIQRHLDDDLDDLRAGRTDIEDRKSTRLNSSH